MNFFRKRCKASIPIMIAFIIMAILTLVTFVGSSAFMGDRTGVGGKGVIGGDGTTTGTGTGPGDIGGGGVGACKWSEIRKDPLHTNIIAVPVPIWKYVNPTVKTPTTMTLRVHRNCAESIQRIFTKIYENGKKPPIKTGDTGCEGYRSDPNSRHQRGAACDVNWDENWCAPNCYNTPGYRVGNFWKPGDILPDKNYAAWVSGFHVLSIPINSPIANAFKNENWGRGLYGGGFDDVMHFSVDGH